MSLCPPPLTQSPSSLLVTSCHLGHLAPLLGPFHSSQTPFLASTFPSDPWDPGVTAQDLLFRGGFSFRRKPQAVLDVTEQVSRHIVGGVVQLGPSQVTWPPPLQPTGTD